MRFFKLLFLALALLLLTKLALAFQFERQIDEITQYPENAPQCIGMSTNKFRGDEYIKGEYFYYICRLSPDIKSFAYYYDKNNKQILNKITLPINFESLQIASPKICISIEEENTVKESCSVFISSGLSGMKGRELSFDMSTVTLTFEDPETIKEVID